MEKWSKKGVRGHSVGSCPWLPIEDIVAEQNAKVVGCKPEEVTAMNTLTANIHFAVVRACCMSVSVSSASCDMLVHVDRQQPLGSGAYCTMRVCVANAAV